MTPPPVIHHPPYTIDPPPAHLTPTAPSPRPIAPPLHRPSDAFACSDESDINGGVCANTEVARAAAEAKWAAEADGHEWCARWARIGECDKNPGYMQSECAKSCEREKAAGLPPAAVDDLLGAVEEVTRYEDCVTTAMKPEVGSTECSV